MQRRSQLIVCALCSALAGGALSAVLVASRSNETKAPDRLPDARTTVRRLSEQYVREFESNGTLTKLGGVEQYVERELDSLVEVYSAARKNHRECVGDAITILEDRYAGQSPEEIQKAAKFSMETGPSMAWPRPIIVRQSGSPYVFCIDMQEWSYLFDRHLFGFGPEMCLRSHLWTTLQAEESDR